MLHKFFMVKKQKMKGKRNVVLDILRNKIKKRYAKGKHSMTGREDVGGDLDSECGVASSETGGLEVFVPGRSVKRAVVRTSAGDGGSMGISGRGAVLNVQSGVHVPCELRKKTVFGRAAELESNSNAVNSPVSNSNAVNSLVSNSNAVNSPVSNSNAVNSLVSNSNAVNSPVSKGSAHVILNSHTNPIPHQSTIHHNPPATHTPHLKKISASLRTIHRFNTLKNRKTFFNRSKHIIESITRRRVDLNDLRMIKWLDGRYTFERDGDDLVVCGVGGLVDKPGSGMAALYDGDVVGGVEGSGGAAGYDKTGIDGKTVLSSVTDAHANTRNDAVHGTNRRACEAHHGKISFLSADAPLQPQKPPEIKNNLKTNESASEKYQRILDRIKTRENARKMQFIAQQHNEPSYSFSTDLINTFSLEGRTCYEYGELKQRMNYVCNIEDEIAKIDGFVVVNRNGKRYVMRRKE
ncbi:hypothetical protein VCUG_01008 [Vavraia culicis subsp. floridensis]|uniref:Uncharacterized protein n=1 Tax=Vavraia culicis (isolate floridensis) TaxID=948595 RepID=L2GUY8_VAVCU|nr:uncharacterized protein VCUG_01008 [Vavraia culicis subsp. floridensis]ELA47476.1 hypothetical protein VCUG_01008 [Vavraia culicis subsp. floridensis]